MPEAIGSTVLYIEFTSYLKIQRTRSTLFISRFSSIFGERERPNQVI